MQSSCLLGMGRKVSKKRPSGTTNSLSAVASAKSDIKEDSHLSLLMIWWHTSMAVVQGRFIPYGRGYTKAGLKYVNND